jgi:hypothetical protein
MKGVFMKVHNLFTPNETITLENYLSKCGIQDTQKYLKCNTVENFDHYPNIRRAVEAIKKTVGDFVYILIDSDP